MPKKNNQKKQNYRDSGERKRFELPIETKRHIWGILLLVAAVVVSLSFFAKAGVAGDIFLKGIRFLIGETVFLIPLVLLMGGFVFLTSSSDFDEARKKERKLFWPITLASVLFLLGITGILGSVDIQLRFGGLVGYLVSSLFLKYFGFWASQVIFVAPILIGVLIFVQFLRHPSRRRPSMPVMRDGEDAEELPKTSLIRKIFTPKFKVKEIAPSSPEPKVLEKPGATGALKLESKPIQGSHVSSYQPPPLDLLELERGAPTSGDTRTNSAIIKKTLENFGIEVAMSEVNIGPTVTQYTFKPAEGVKLSKITGLSNDLALALASHPIRIEAPIPGRSLVGIETPNKVRAQVRLRNMLESPQFQKSPAQLLLAIGKDVSGVPFYADLAKMPHMLVAGSTGSGKTIFLNSLIMNLLYQPTLGLKSAGPEALRLILVDPKRVEFPVYSNLPHLLCPVIYNASQTLNALRWLTSEMERRFDVLSSARTRDIVSFNDRALKNGIDPLPFIVVVIDELADLMAARGRDIEAAIVRLAQMARAVGIHLVVATQRPSVEVITGLIKANITSRVTFQLASQIDSRTVLDSAGAEKLLGAGDMLYLSSETTKPKRLQAAYVSEREVKKVVSYVQQKTDELDIASEMEEGLLQEIEKGLQETENGGGDGFSDGDDPLYEEARRVVIEARKASASLLQRRLRIGYARAARLIDILEDKGVVGPGEGAKPREVYGVSGGAPERQEVPYKVEVEKEDTKEETEQETEEEENETEEEEDEKETWHNV